MRVWGVSRVYFSRLLQDATRCVRAPHDAARVLPLTRIFHMSNQSNPRNPPNPHIAGRRAVRLASAAPCPLVDHHCRRHGRRGARPGDARRNVRSTDVCLPSTAASPRRPGTRRARCSRLGHQPSRRGAGCPRAHDPATPALVDPFGDHPRRGAARGPIATSAASSAPRPPPGDCPCRPGRGRLAPARVAARATVAG